MQGCGNRNKARRFYGRARGRVRQAANGKAARRDQAMDRAAPSTRKARAQH
jgi:hypothetical protein